MTLGVGFGWELCEFVPAQARPSFTRVSRLYPAYPAKMARKWWFESFFWGTMRTIEVKFCPNLQWSGTFQQKKRTLQQLAWFRNCGDYRRWRKTGAGIQVPVQMKTVKFISQDCGGLQLSNFVSFKSLYGCNFVQSLSSELLIFVGIHPPVPPKYPPPPSPFPYGKFRR